MSALFGLLKEYKAWFWTAVLASIANKILDLMPPLLVAWLIASVSGHTPTWIYNFINIHDPLHLAIFFGALVIVVFGAESFTQWLYTYGFMTLTQRVQHALRLATYEKIQSRELAFFEQHRVGETMSMINDDVNQLERFLNDGLNEILQLITLIIFSTYVLFDNNVALALMGLSPIPVIVIWSLAFQKRLKPRYKKVRQAVGELATRLENNLSGITIIKSFTAENYELKRLSKASAAYAQANHEAIQITALFVPLIRMVVAIGFAGVLLLGCYWLITGQHGVTLAILVMFSMLIQRILWPLTRLGSTIDDLERARASAHRVFRLLHTEPEIIDPAHPKKLMQVKGEIQFEDVDFAYQGHQPVLHKLNFNISPGEVVGIAGHTGTGKSTLVKLLLRFYDVTSGAIKIDGYDIRDITLYDLRRHIALVSQDVYLFHGSIRENIAYSLQQVSEEEIIAAAKTAQLHDFVMSLPQAYDTIVGERGIKLSGGQRQRLSIARALLKQSPIIVLDEATSSVDTQTEQAIQQNLKEIIAGKTALIIAHRLSTIRDADRIMVMRNGQIIEQGKHDELVELAGSYSDLWKVQSGMAARENYLVT